MRKHCTHRLLIGPGLDRALFPSYIGFMTGHEQKRASMWGWGIFASFFVHAVIALVILVGIPFDLPKPEAEETVSVEIVPPPEEAQQAEPAKPEPEITVPEKAEEPPAEETAEKPAQQPESEQQQPQPPPPPSSPPAEPPQQQAEQAPEPPSEPPAQVPDTPQAEQASPSLDNFRPVFQFGDKDQGPEQSLQGSAAKEETATEAAVTEETQSSKDADAAQQEDAGGASADAGQTPAEPALPTEQPTQAEAAEKPVGMPLPDVLAVQDAGQASVSSEADGVPEPGNMGDAARADNALAERDGDKKPEGAPGNSEAAGGGAKPSLKKAEKLFSTSATDNPMAMVAMGTMSRGERAAELCNSELGAQLANGTPRYAASRLPKPRLRSGNVIDVETAFSTRSQWYNVSFRCEVDKDAMKVVSFAHDVGSAIPKNEWKSRHLPSPY
jgi:hypothetical protein